MSSFDVEGATAAIESAGGLDHLMNVDNGTAQPVQPNEQPTQQTTTPSVQAPQESATQPDQWTRQQRDEYGRWTQAQQAAQDALTPAPQVPQDTSFTGLDPNTIPDSLKPFYTSMQADYTRKTQELAQQRQQISQLGDLTEVQQAVELHRALQDPTQWPALHEQLSLGLQAMGYSKGEADQAAASSMQQATTPTPDLSAFESDPDLAPFKQMVEGLQTKVSGLENQLQQRAQVEQQARLQDAIIGELTRQENIIRTNNPTYTDGDIESIYELSSYYGGNLVQAQQRFEQIYQDRFDRWVAEKGHAVATNGAPLPAATMTATTQQARPTTIDDAHPLVMERIKQLESQGLL